MADTCPARPDVVVATAAHDGSVTWLVVAAVGTTVVHLRLAAHAPDPARLTARPSLAPLPGLPGVHGRTQVLCGRAAGDDLADTAAVARLRARSVLAPPGRVLCARCTAAAARMPEMRWAIPPDWRGRADADGQARLPLR